MYGLVHKAFVQAMMCRRILPWKKAKELLENILKNFPNEDPSTNLQSIIDEVNSKLLVLKMQLRDVICEVTRERYCVLVLTVETYVARLSSKYTPNENQLFNKIMEEIITSGNGYAYFNTCINLSSKLPENMSKLNAEGFIRRLLNDKWLTEGEKGEIYLGARCITEMEPMIRDVYNAYVGNCPLCQRLAIMGERCDSCLCVIHFHCLERYKLGRQEESIRKCMGCGADWNNFNNSED